MNNKKDTIPKHMTKDLLKEYLVDWLKSYIIKRNTNSFGDVCCIMIFCKGGYNDLANHLADKIWEKMQPKTKPSGTFESLYPPTNPMALRVFRQNEEN